MSKKTLIAILFTTIIICISLVSAYLKNDSFKYELVNSTKDEVYECTVDKKKNYLEEVLKTAKNNINEKNNSRQIVIDINNVENKDVTTTSNSIITNSSINKVNDNYQLVSRSSEIVRNVSNGEENNEKDANIENLSTISGKNVDTITEKVCVKEEFIQGVKISTFNNITYNVYSNGEKDVINNIQSVEFDNSSYNGNTGTLINEANNNIYKYSDKIGIVVNLTNQYRREIGLNNLVLDKSLSVAASVRALEMAYTNKLSHTRPDGASCFIVLSDLGIKYNCAGENIGDGFRYAENVCKAWKNSESHYKNIANRKYNKIGIGVAQGLDGKYYWVQIFSD